MFAFGLIKSVERGTLRFNRDYLAKLAGKAGLKVLDIATMGLVLPNRTPKVLLPFFKVLDGKYPMGFYNVMVCRKDQENVGR